MKAPVWALIQRITIFGGNSGYHRYELINQAILHFWEWFLVGTKNPSSLGVTKWATSPMLTWPMPWKAGFSRCCFSWQFSGRLPLHRAGQASG